MPELQHDPRFCDTAFHRDPGDGSDPGDCVGQAVTVGAVGAYLKGTEAGPMVAVMPLPLGALVPPLAAAAFARDLLAMVARVTGHGA